MKQAFADHQKKALIYTCARALLAVVLAASSLFVLPARRAAAGDVPEADGLALPILMYHEVKPRHSGKDAITPWELESDLKYLRQAGYHSVTMRELIDYESGAGTLPEKPVVLSFDDGYLSNYVYVYPLLAQYDMKIVLSIIGKDSDDFTARPSDNLNYAHVTWEQAREMQQSGRVELQNHTYDMHRITARRFGCQKRPGETQEAYARALTGDVRRCQDSIEAATGVRPDTFTYPYGRVSGESVPVLRTMGFCATLTCDFGVNVLKKQPGELYGLRRIARAHGTNAKKCIDAGMKTLRFRHSARLPEPAADGIINLL